MGAGDGGSGRKSSAGGRPLVLAALAVVAGVLALVGPGLASAQSGGASGQGSFGPLFEEPDEFTGPGEKTTAPDGVDLSPSVCKKVVGDDRTEDQRKADPENDGFIDCKVPAASISVFPGGKLLSWNAVDSTENVKGGIAFEFGVASIDDRTRAFEIPNGAEKAEESSFKKPDPEDGGANPDGNPDTDPLVPFPGSSDEAQNDGSLFCADHTFLPNGQVIGVGGTQYYNDPGAANPGQQDPRVDKVGAVELQGIRNSRAYDPETNRWSDKARMNKGRWYPTLVSLGDVNGDGEADQKIFTASGVTRLIKPVYTGGLPPVDSNGNVTAPVGPMQMPEGGDQRPGAQESGRNVTVTENYDVRDDRWDENGQKGAQGEEGDPSERSLPLFPRMHLLPNGHVFYNVGGQSFNPFGQSYDQVKWNIAASFDPKEQKWKSLGIPGGTDSTDPATVSTAGFRGSTHSVMLPIEAEDGEYTKARFLTAGGLAAQAAGSPGTYFPTRQSRITEVDTGDGNKITTRSTGPLKNRGNDAGPENVGEGEGKNAPDAPPQTGRWYMSTQVLPTGEVVGFAGADRDEVAYPGVEKAVTEVEIFDPEADNPQNPAADDGQGAWRPDASAQRRRTYHNTSALLADGRILLGGHATISTGYARNTNIADRGPNNHDPTHEIYTPPNLTPEALKASGKRPAITSAPGCVDNDEEISLGTDVPADQVESVVMIRNVTQTHVVDGDQRSVKLEKVETDDGSLRVKVPGPNVLPPGPYMTFVNRTGDNGKPVPSVAAQVAVGPGACTTEAAARGNADDDEGGDGGGASDLGQVAQGEVLGVGAGPRACLPDGLRARVRGIGPLRIGQTRGTTLRAAGVPPANQARRALRYCVRGGGRTYVSYSGRGRAQMVVSVAPAPKPRGVNRGVSSRQVRRQYSGVQRLGRKQLVVRYRGGSVVFGVKQGRVRYVAVVDRRLSRNVNLLRYYLRGVRLQ